MGRWVGVCVCVCVEVSIRVILSSGHSVPRTPCL